MKIDGRALSEQLLGEVAARVAAYKTRGIQPSLTVILVGDDPGSLSYIKQKQKAAESVGITLNFVHLPASCDKPTLSSIIEQYNADPKNHALIIQRPVPISAIDETLNSIALGKDVDGFIQDSPFRVPVASAVVKIIEVCYGIIAPNTPQKFAGWLPQQQIAVIGRGDTAGKPIKELLEKLGCQPMNIHSQTPNSAEIMAACDIVVSCVGKPQVVTSNHIKSGAIVISVGLWRDEGGKLHGDYEEEDIAKVAGFFTPTPGGVGPVNVACLLENVIMATERQMV